MMVRAIAKMGKDLSQKSLNSFHHKEEDFQLKIGDIYPVYGINLWGEVLHYLTFIRYGDNPCWTPAKLYEIVDYRLPPNWYFQFYGYDKSINAIWGYKELITDPTHRMELINREGESLTIFNNRRKEIDDYFGHNE